MPKPHDQWSQDHIDKMDVLKAQGKTLRQVADALGVSIARVKGRSRWQSMTPQQKEERCEQMRRRRHKEYVPARRVHTASGPSVPDKAIDDRSARYAAPVRDLTAAFFGDPPVGYSALERRA